MTCRTCIWMVLMVIIRCMEWFNRYYSFVDDIWSIIGIILFDNNILRINNNSNMLSYQVTSMMIYAQPLLYIRKHFFTFTKRQAIIFTCHYYFIQYRSVNNYAIMHVSLFQTILYTIALLYSFWSRQRLYQQQQKGSGTSEN